MRTIRNPHPYPTNTHRRRRNSEFHRCLHRREWTILSKHHRRCRGYVERRCWVSLEASRIQFPRSYIAANRLFTLTFFLLSKNLFCHGPIRFVLGSSVALLSVFTLDFDGLTTPDCACGVPLSNLGSSNLGVSVPPTVVIRDRAFGARLSCNSAFDPIARQDPRLGILDIPGAELPHIEIFAGRNDQGKHTVRSICSKSLNSLNLPSTLRFFEPSDARQDLHRHINPTYPEPKSCLWTQNRPVIALLMRISSFLRVRCRGGGIGVALMLDSKDLWILILFFFELFLNSSPDLGLYDDLNEI
ncbi:hypothetical protein PM082_024027 [Marasmius tenuissimus]|nr:hypothetical protein PM082_024027 [Marasmius tenuissimus]